MRRPLQRLSPASAQNRQIACWTKRGKLAGIGGIEPARIDLAGDPLDDRGAAARGIAAGAVGMLGLEIPQNAGAVQEIVHQRIDRDHHRAGFDPGWPLGVPGKQQLRESHRQHLVRHAVNVSERLEQGLTQPRGSIGCRNGIDVCQPAVDPADDVAISQIAHEQEEAVGGLVQPAVAQIMSRQGAVGPMLGVGARVRVLPVPAILEQPVALELRAARLIGECGGDVLPSDPAMLLHVAISNAVRHALIAQRIDQPIENGRRVVSLYRRDDALSRQADPGIVDQGPGAGILAYMTDQPGALIESSTGWPRVLEYWPLRQRTLFAKCY